MLTFLRSQSKYFMAVLLGLVFFSFALLFNVNSLEQFQIRGAGKIDGKGISFETLNFEQQNTHLMMQLSQGGRLPNSEQVRQVVNKMTWQRLLLVAEADRLGVVVTDQEVADFMMKLPIFQKDGKYHPESYQQFVRGYLAAQHITSERFEQIIREQLRVEVVRKALLGSVNIGPQESREVFDQMMGPVRMTAVRLALTPYLTKVSVSSEEIAKEYEAKKSMFQTEERRQVAYAGFLLTPAQQKAPEKEKSEAKAKLAEAAQRFTGEVYGLEGLAGNFSERAQKAGAIAGVSEFFSRSEPAKPIAPSVGFNRAAFRLATEDPVSSPVETDDGYYVLYLKGIQPSQPKALEMVTETIRQRLTQQKAMEMLRQEGEVLASKLSQEVQKGTKFKAAATALKLTVTDVPEFKPAEPQNVKDQDLPALVRLSQSLKVGTVSGFEATATGGLIALIEERKPTSNDEFTKIRSMIDSEMLSRRQAKIMDEWFLMQSRNPRHRLPDNFATASLPNS